MTTRLERLTIALIQRATIQTDLDDYALQDRRNAQRIAAMYVTIARDFDRALSAIELADLEAEQGVKRDVP